MTDRPRAVVIGVGNEYRRDDGVGPAVLAALAGRVPPGVRLVHADGEPGALLEVWAGVPLAVVVDAVVCQPPRPGLLHRTSVGGLTGVGTSASSHGLGIPEAVRLAEVLDRMPGELVVYAVEAADVNLGVGLSAAVAAAVPEVADRVRAELAR